MAEPLLLRALDQVIICSRKLSMSRAKICRSASVRGSLAAWIIRSRA